MSSSSSTSPSKKADDLYGLERPTYARWIAGYDIEFSSDDKDTIKDNIKAKDIDVYELFEQLTSPGCKVSVSLDARNNVYLASIFRNLEGYPDSGYGMTSRARTVERALAGLDYVIRDKHEFDILAITRERVQSGSDF